MDNARIVCFLGATVESRLFWRPHVTTLAIQLNRIIALIPRVRVIRSGSSIQLPSLHLTLILSHILCAALFTCLTQSLWQQLGRIHRAGLRMGLGIPSFSRTQATWTETPDIAVSLHA